MARATFITPIGVARFPSLDKPDTEGKFPTNKYKLDIGLDENGVREARAKIKAFIDENKDEFKGEKPASTPLKTYKNKETGEEIPYIRLMSKKRPLVIDTQKNVVPKSVTVAGGSRVRGAGKLAVYETGGKIGITGYLDAVQVIELYQGFNPDDLDDVSGEDGFVVEESKFEDVAVDDEDSDF